MAVSVSAGGLSPSLWITIACVGIVLIAFCFASPLRLLCLSTDYSDSLSSSLNLWREHVYRDEDGKALHEPDEQARGRIEALRLLIPAFALGALVFSVPNFALFGPDTRKGLILGG